MSAKDPEPNIADDKAVDIAAVRDRIETLPVARRHDPYWDLDGRAVRDRRRARRAVRTVVRFLAATILALILARLAATDASAVLLGPNRHLVFVTSTADAIASCLVFAHQVRRRRGYVALTRAPAM